MLREIIPRLSLVLLSVVLAASTTNADRICLHPTDDAEINQRSPDQNYGSSTRMRTANTYGGGGSSDWTKQVLIRFDLSQIDPDVDVVDARIRLHYYDYDDTDPAGRELSVYRTIEPWQESTVTWNTGPETLTFSCGASVVPDDFGWMDWDVSAEVQYLLDHPGENLGWLIADPTYWGQANIPVTMFHTKESGDFTPRLSITLAGPPEEVWAERYDGSFHLTDEAVDVAVDHEGFAYVLGRTTHQYGTSFSIIKYHPTTGGLIWDVDYGGVYDINTPRGLVVDETGVYATGQTLYWDEDPDYLTVKYTLEGEFEWAKTYNGPRGKADSAYGIALCGDYVCVTGESDDGLVLEDFDVVTISYNKSDGARHWIDRFNEANDDFAAAITVDDNCNVYITGGNYQGVAASYDYLTIRYDGSSGDRDWVETYDGTGAADGFDFARDIAAYGNAVYITGESAGYLSGKDIVTIKYDAASGSREWTKRYNGPGDCDDEGLALAVNDEGIYVTGHACVSVEWQDARIQVLKYAPDSGDLDWASDYSVGVPYSWDVGRDIAVDECGDVYVVGEVVNNLYDFDCATLKCDPSDGDVLWVAHYDNSEDDWGRGIAVDGCGGVFVTATSEGSGAEDIATVRYVLGTAPVPEDPQPPMAVGLLRSYPNPFKRLTTIEFSLPDSRETSVAVYDAQGRRIASLFEGDLPAGVHSLQWNSTGFPSGIYFCRLNIGGHVTSRRLIRLRE